MMDTLRNLDTLKVLNQERLARVPIMPAAIAFDVHGFTYGKDGAVNDAILAEQARLLRGGCVLAAVTGFGDRIHLAQTRPLLPHLHRLGLKPEEVPLFLSTRNGALTTHAFTDELIDHHPITPEMYTAITSHPLVAAVERLTRLEVKTELAREYAETQAVLGFELHPRRTDFPGIRHDWHPGTQSGYQLTLMYEPGYLEGIGSHDEEFRDVQTIMEYAGGALPASPHILAPIIKQALAAGGVEVATNTAGSHPEIDIALPGIDKSLGCRALLPRIALLRNISEEDVMQNSIGGGDSPKYNDRPLIQFFGHGVTNIDYWDEGENGPIVLDYSQITDQIARTLQLFRSIN